MIQCRAHESGGVGIILGAGLCGQDSIFRGCGDFDLDNGHTLVFLIDDLILLTRFQSSGTNPINIIAKSSQILLVHIQISFNHPRSHSRVSIS
jgi:hypothetical protein